MNKSLICKCNGSRVCCLNSTREQSFPCIGYEMSAPSFSVEAEYLSPCLHKLMSRRDRMHYIIESFPADPWVHRGSSSAKEHLRSLSFSLSLTPQTHPLPPLGYCTAKQALCTSVSCTAQRYKALSETSTSSSCRRLYFSSVFSNVVKRPLRLEVAVA